MTSLYALPDGRHIAVGEIAGTRDLDTVLGPVDRFETAVVLPAAALGEHHAALEKQVSNERLLVDGLKAEVDRLRALTRLDAETFTAPDGRFYDLTISYRDANQTLWTPIGWLAPFDGDPTPYLECRGSVVDMATVIKERGPLTPEPAS